MALESRFGNSSGPLCGPRKKLLEFKWPWKVVLGIQVGGKCGRLGSSSGPFCGPRKAFLEFKCLIGVEEAAWLLACLLLSCLLKWLLACSLVRLLACSLA